jgi:hypothetical protein
MGGRGRCRGSACCRSQHVKVYVPLGLTIQRDILAACHLGGRRIVGLHQPSRARPRAIGHRRALAGFLTGRFTFSHHVAVVQSLCAPDSVYRYRGAGDFPEYGRRAAGLTWGKTISSEEEAKRSGIRPDACSRYRQSLFRNTRVRNSHHRQPYYVALVRIDEKELAERPNVWLYWHAGDGDDSDRIELPGRTARHVVPDGVSTEKIGRRPDVGWADDD